MKYEGNNEETARRWLELSLVREGTAQVDAATASGSLRCYVRHAPNKAALPMSPVAALPWSTCGELLGYSTFHRSALCTVVD